MTVTIKVLIPAKQAENTQTTQYTATNCKAIQYQAHFIRKLEHFGPSKQTDLKIEQLLLVLSKIVLV